MANAWNYILNIKSVGRGASGTTLVPGIRRARLNFNYEKIKSRSGASEVPDDIRVLGGEPTLQIECESLAELCKGVTSIKAAMEANTLEKLIVKWDDGSGTDQILTLLSGRWTDIKECEFPPREKSRDANTYQAEFSVCQAATGDGKKLSELVLFT